MLCQRCKKNEADFVQTRTVNGISSHISLCDGCARLAYQEDFSTQERAQDQLVDVTKLLYAQLIGGLGGAVAKPNVGIKCKDCGTDIEEFKRTLYVGCPNCYMAFGSVMTSVLKSVQDSTMHKGARNLQHPNKQSKELQIKSIKQQLEQAVAEERYGDAVELQDILKKLEQK